MELGTLSILVQLLLIFVLVALFAGRRWMRLHRQRRNSAPGRPAAVPSDASQWPSSPAVMSTLPPAPVLVELPMAMRRPPMQEAPNLVSEELLPPCFADTCADWAQVGPVSVPAHDTRFSLADWSAPTDRVALDMTPEPAVLDWALEAPVEAPRPRRAAQVRASGGSMSCTIAPPAHHCA